MQPSKSILKNSSVISKEFLLERRLKALLVEENYLFYDEGRCLMRAFQLMGAAEFEWCKTYDFLESTGTVQTHTCACKYDAFVSDYLEFDESIQYWDRLMYLPNSPVYVLHTAYGHLIYAGPDAFINAIEVNEKPTVMDGWLHIVGTYYPDPELNKAYRFKH